MCNKFDEEDTAADVAIVGLGPGGLSAALEIAHQGKKCLPSQIESTTFVDNA